MLSMEEEAREVGIDKDLKKKINETVRSILKRSSLYRITEMKAREEASTELNLDLSQDPYKLIVRNAVESFIEEAIATINNEMGNMKTEIGEDEEGSETATKKKTKKKKKKNKESETHPKIIGKNVVADVYKPPPSSFAVFDINSIEEPWLKLESDIDISPLQDDLDEKPPRAAVLDTIEAANAGAGDDAPKTWDEVSKALETHLKPAVAVPDDSPKPVMFSVKSPALPPPQKSPSFHTLEELEAKTKRDSPKPTTVQLRKTETARSESNQTESTQTNTSASKLQITGSRSVKENIFVLRDRERREKEGNKKPVMNWDPLREYPEKCPPGGGDGLVVYTTSLQGVRRTYEDCMRVRAIMEQQGVVVDERDVALDAGVLKELKELLDGATTAAEVAPPRVFIKGRYLGGAAEVTAMNENGKLGRVLRWARVERIGEEGRHTCEGCGGARWVPCLECGGSCKVSTAMATARGERWERCVKCNENGLIRCPVCFVH